MKPSLTLVIGLPGVGKSTVARLIAEKSGAVIINSDIIRRELFPEKRDYSPQETQAVIRETDRRVQTLLKEGKSVILDALFTKQRPRNYYRQLAGNTGTNFTILFVTANDEAVKERLELRAQKGDPSEATFEYYLNRKAKFVPIKGEHVTIDNSGDFETLKRQVGSMDI